MPTQPARSAGHPSSAPVTTAASSPMSSLNGRAATASPSCSISPARGRNVQPRPRPSRHRAPIARRCRLLPRPRRPRTPSRPAHHHRRVLKAIRESAAPAGVPSGRSRCRSCGGHRQPAGLPGEDAEDAGRSFCVPGSASGTARPATRKTRRARGQGRAGMGQPPAGSGAALSPIKTARTSPMAGSWLAGSGSGRCAWI
jgi:hypothetical protein